MESEKIRIPDTQIEKEKTETSLEEHFINAAKMVLEGKLSGINVREGNGGLKLFNAGPMLIYEGYQPEQEYLKGLICHESPEGLKIVAPCFRKFYNLGEKPDNDQRFYQLIQDPDVVVNFPEKIDGTNIRFYVHPKTGEIKAATRGMIDGGKDPDEEGFGEAANIHFGQESLKIAQEQFPQVLDKDLLERFTPIFELIHPENRIVTNYGQRRDLILLAVFDKQKRCRELTRRELMEFSEKYGLHLVDTLHVSSSNWDEALKELQQQWEGTDKEGVVVTVEQGGEVVFRIKVKSKEYLELMRAMKSCTLNKTMELIAELKATSWEELKSKIHERFPNLPEEVMMGYEAHYQTIESYNNEIARQADSMIASYNEFILQNHQITFQKDFALAIQNRPDKPYFFLLRKFGPEKIDEARSRIIEQLKKGQPIKEFPVKAEQKIE
jgi:hypothetical protein